MGEGTAHLLGLAAIAISDRQIAAKLMEGTSLRCAFIRNVRGRFPIWCAGGHHFTCFDGSADP